jgi:hypothetical protein
MIEWRRVPWPLWVYSVVTLAGASLTDAEAHAPISAKALLIAVMLAWLYGLFMGVRWVWIGTVGIYVLGFIPDLASGSPKWWGVAVSLVGLMLLLLPITRRYFFSRTAVPIT